MIYHSFSPTVCVQLRAAAINGVAHELSLKQAELHQRSLDARKLTSLVDLSSTQSILETVPRLHFRVSRYIMSQTECVSLYSVFSIFITAISYIGYSMKPTSHKRMDEKTKNLRVHCSESCMNNG